MEHLECIQVLEGHDDRVWSVAWSPDGRTLASCSGDKTIRIWGKTASDTWALTAVLEDTHSRTIRSLSWSPDGRQLATASFDATTAIWRIQGGVWEQVATLEGHENEVKGVAWSPCGTLLATCGRDKTVWIWESLPGNEYECVDVKHGHSQDVKALAWHPSGELLASCSYDNSIKLWVNDGDEWVCAQTLGGSVGLGHTSTVWSIAFNSSGSQLASCSDDKTVCIWDCHFSGSQPRFQQASTLTGYHSRTIFSLEWSSEGVLATGDGDNCIRLFRRGGDGAWEVVCGAEQAHDLDVNCVRWCPADAGVLASASDDGTVKVWRLRGAAERAAAAAAVEGS